LQIGIGRKEKKRSKPSPKSGMAALSKVDDGGGFANDFADPKVKVRM
jgi:hypothetical protein